MPLYYKPGSNEIESSADAVIRMKLYRQLTLATPHHAQLVRNNKEGDCYGYMKLCLKDVLTTASTHFLAMRELGRLTFKDGKTINELATELTELQMKANRIQPNSITDELLKGALLSLTLPHPRFKQLATEFSKTTCVDDYDTILLELMSHEANENVLRPPLVRHQAHALTEDETKGRKNNASQPDVAMLLEALVNLSTSPRGRGKPSAPKTDTSSHPCRNFRAGKPCYQQPCQYSHAPSDAADSPQKKITCYNCQKLGSHVAADCTAPKEERRRPRPGLQANHTGGSAPPRGGKQLNVQAFMKQLMRASSESKHGDANADDESAHMLVEVGLDLEAAPSPSPLAALVVGDAYYPRASAFDVEAAQAANLASQWPAAKPFLCLAYMASGKPPMTEYARFAKTLMNHGFEPPPELPDEEGQRLWVTKCEERDIFFRIDYYSRVGLELLPGLPADVPLFFF